MGWLSRKCGDIKWKKPKGMNAVWVKKLRLYMAYALCISLGTTAAILLLEGRWKEALPLHLCGLSAVLAVLSAIRPRVWMLDFLWYLGMPGALLALVFPAPAVSRFHFAMNLSYAVTHLLILIIPLVLIVQGLRPGRGKAAAMMLRLNLIALPVFAVNRLLETDYLFLAAPPAGTPLETAFSFGRPVYFLALEMIVFLSAMGMEKLAGFLFRAKAE